MAFTELYTEDLGEGVDVALVQGNQERREVWITAPLDPFEGVAKMTLAQAQEVYAALERLLEAAEA